MSKPQTQNMWFPWKASNALGEIFLLVPSKVSGQVPKHPHCGSPAKSPILHSKNLAGLWIHGRNKSKVTVRRRGRGKKKPLRKFLSFFTLIQSYQGCEEVLRKSNERGQRECQMEANAGEEWGRRESVLPASNWHATSHHIPRFFSSC